MANPNSKPAGRISPLMIGVILGLGLMLFFFLGQGGGQTDAAEPHPWRVLTVSNVAIHRRDLPTRVICPLPEGANAVSHPTADCYFRASLQYNPVEEAPSAADCQLPEGFASLVVGVGEEAATITSQPVDLAAEAGDCSLKPGIVAATLFEFESVPRTEKLTLIRFVGIDPQLELDENLTFVIDRP